jgi:hypothetical protein
MSSVLRREMKVVAPLASELSGAGQSRAESSRGVLLCCYFLLLLRMVNITIQVPRFRLESRCSHRRRVVVKAVVIVVRGGSTSAARPLLGKKENLTLSKFALSSAHHQNDLYGQHDARAPEFFMLGRLPATRSAFHPMGFAPNRRQALDCRPQKTPAVYRHPRSRLWLVAERPTHKKSARPMSWGHPEQFPTSGHPRATPTRGALAEQSPKPRL